MKIKFTKGSDNIFKDLGLPNAEELLAKAKLAVEITVIIKNRGISQQQAAKLAGTSQAKISDVVRGNLDQFTIDRLIKMLMAFDQDVRIELAPKPRSRAHAIMTVAVA